VPIDLKGVCPCLKRSNGEVRGCNWEKTKQWIVIVNRFQQQTDAVSVARDLRESWYINNRVTPSISQSRCNDLAF